MQPLPRIHLWLFNHAMKHVSDQVVFFLEAFRQHGYDVTVGADPDRHALNFVIENMAPAAVETISEFCTRTGKKLGIIMTEHIDFERGQFIFHGALCGVGSEYMSGDAQWARLINLLRCYSFTRALFALGDLPKLTGWEDVFQGIPKAHIPFPHIHSSRVAKDAAPPMYDFVFTGKSTSFRRSVVHALEKKYKVASTSHFISRRQRDLLNQQAKIVVNIPQDDAWAWLSPMRIIASLYNHRASLSIGTNDNSAIAQCCVQLPLDSPELYDRLDALLADWQGSYQTAQANYQQIATRYETANPFPAPLLTLWDTLEHSPHRRRA